MKSIRKFIKVIAFIISLITYMFSLYDYCINGNDMSNTKVMVVLAGVVFAFSED